MIQGILGKTVAQHFEQLRSCDKAYGSSLQVDKAAPQMQALFRIMSVSFPLLHHTYT